MEPKLEELANLIGIVIADGAKLVEKRKVDHLLAADTFEWNMHAYCVHLEIEHSQAVDLNRIANALEELARR